nr:immunoglobulin heavy chain junction region [Mus musculus]
CAPLTTVVPSFFDYW